MGANGHAVLWKRGTRGTRTAPKEGCQHPWETSHRLGNWLPRGPSALKASQKSEPQTNAAHSCLRAPLAGDRHLYREESRRALQESTHRPGLPVRQRPAALGPRTPPLEARGPAHWAGPRMGKARGQLCGAERRVSGCKAPTRTQGPLDALPPKRPRPRPRAINKINSAEGACGVWGGSRVVPTGRGTLAQGSVSSPSPPGGSLPAPNGSARKAQHTCVPGRSFGPRRFTCLLLSLPRSPLWCCDGLSRVPQNFYAEVLTPRPWGWDCDHGL